MKIKSCDKCKRVEDVEGNCQEFAIIKHTFGYGTVYDGRSVELDICEDCFIELFKEQL